MVINTFTLTHNSQVRKKSANCNTCRKNNTQKHKKKQETHIEFKNFKICTHKCVLELKKKKIE